MQTAAPSTDPRVEGTCTMRPFLFCVCLGVGLAAALPGLPAPAQALHQLGEAKEGARAEPEKAKAEEVAWGKPVNGLAVSIAPAGDEQGRFVVRWKNVGEDTLELPWVRFGSDKVYKNRDDLLNHVFLKAADGKLAPARAERFPEIGGPPYRPRTVILAPGKTHEETIDPGTYVQRPAEAGRRELWVELEIKSAYAPSREGARYWTGKVRSNVLSIGPGK